MVNGARKLARAYLALGIVGCVAAVGMLVFDVRATDPTDHVSAGELGVYLLQALPYVVWLSFYCLVRKTTSRTRLYITLSIGLIFFGIENLFRYAVLFATTNEHAAMALLVLPYWTAVAVLLLLVLCFVRPKSNQQQVDTPAVPSKVHSK
ncbi:MAG TPA: hypothetical protein VF773_03170 [Verrucomicrobiae bacterium]